MNIQKSETLLVIFNAGLSAAFSFVFLYATVTLLGLADRGQFAFLQSISLTLVNVMRLGLHQQIQVLSSSAALVQGRHLVVTQSFYLSSLAFIIVFCLVQVGATSELHLPASHAVTIPLYVASLLTYANCTFLVQMTASAGKNLFQICTYYGVLFATILTIELEGSVNVEDFLSAVIIANAIGSLQCLYALRLRPSFRLRLVDVPSQLRGGIKVFGWSNLKDLMYRIDLLILPAMLDAKSYGHYTIIQNLAQSSWRVIDPLLGYYNRLLILTGSGVKADPRFVMSKNISMVVLCLSTATSAMLTLIISYLTPQINANIFGLTFIFCLTTTGFALWKKTSIEELALGRHSFMYKSIVTFLFAYLILSPLIRNLSGALLLASSLMAVLTLWTLRVDKARA